MEVGSIFNYITPFASATNWSLVFSSNISDDVFWLSLFDGNEFGSVCASIA
jgi:hypothetical protein